eukprot:TRINITY_DN1357_c2_g1_i1.p1 TRINITY_DN1357_c2_g1~~TRINITY_DN1357_c2_g1_i1.p1  ORF type:complete len:233 (-),score=75.47 TRINITY_DN1357_c2_g1_i1:66-764(-)
MAQSSPVRRIPLIQQTRDEARRLLQEIERVRATLYLVRYNPDTPNEEKREQIKVLILRLRDLEKQFQNAMHSSYDQFEGSMHLDELTNLHLPASHTRKRTESGNWTSTAAAAAAAAAAPAAAPAVPPVVQREITPSGRWKGAVERVSSEKKISSKWDAMLDRIMRPHNHTSAWESQMREILHIVESSQKLDPNQKSLLQCTLYSLRQKKKLTTEEEQVQKAIQQYFASHNEA